MKLINWRTFYEVYLNPKWRLNNWEYLLYLAVWNIVYFLLIKGLEYLETMIPYIWILTFAAFIFWLICRIFLWIKRCHDLWHSWAWLFWYLCPIFNLVFPFTLWFERWDPKENKYWKVPEKISKIIKSITVFAVILWGLLIGYLYYSVTSKIEFKLPENLQEPTTSYEISTHEELIEMFWNDNMEKLSNYKIPRIMLEKDPDLIELILWSLSLWKVEEKQEWFNLYPLMDEWQKENLRDILIREKDKLMEIEEKYQLNQNSWEINNS